MLWTEILERVGISRAAKRLDQYAFGLSGGCDPVARPTGAQAMHLHTVAKYGSLTPLYEAAGFRITHTGPRPKGDDGHPRAFLRKWLDPREEPT